MLGVLLYISNVAITGDSSGHWEHSRRGGRCSSSARKCSLIDIGHLPRTLLRFGVIPVLPASFSCILLPGLVG